MADNAQVVRAETVDCVAHVPVVIVGGGATGLCAALAVRDAGVEVLVIERDRQPMGTTSMSTGLIPAAGSRLQQARGISDSAAQFAADIAAMAKGKVDMAVWRGWRLNPQPRSTGWWNATQSA